MQKKNKKNALKLRFYALVKILQSLIKCPEKFKAYLNENKIELK